VDHRNQILDLMVIANALNRPTLGELQQSTPWIWLWCERCQHHAPFACAVAVTLWGADASSDKLRASARCTRCGGKGATLQRPGWAGNNLGFYPFPTDALTIGQK
jgi:hypothetical protein